MEDRLVLQPSPSHPIMIEPAGTRVVVTVAGTVVARCHDSGLLREGVTGEDIVQLIIGLATLARLPSDAPSACGQDGPVRAAKPASATWRRQLRIAMDGLRPVHGKLA
jgi:hypothetical protein